jgi:hypothetical protein
MPFINYDKPDAGGSGYVKEAINTDYVQRAYYNATVGEATIHITYMGESSKYVKGSVATDIYQYIQALPNFIEVSKKSPKGSGKAVELFNLNHALHLFYREKDASKGEAGEAVLRIDYGVSKEIIERAASDTPRADALTESSQSIRVVGDEAEAIWKKYQGTAI